jgi:hypothetical protein
MSASLAIALIRWSFVPMSVGSPFGRTRRAACWAYASQLALVALTRPDASLTLALANSEHRPSHDIRLSRYGYNTDTP